MHNNAYKSIFYMVLNKSQVILTWKLYLDSFPILSSN